MFAHGLTSGHARLSSLPPRRGRRQAVSRRTRPAAGALTGSVASGLTCGLRSPVLWTGRANSPILFSLRTLSRIRLSRVSQLSSPRALWHACAALLQEPPVRLADDVVSALRVLHQGPPVVERSSLGALPLLRQMLIRSARPSIPSQIRHALRPASADLLLRLLSEVVSVLLRGGPRRCSAFRTWRDHHGRSQTQRLTSRFGESIRRLSSKVAVDLITDHARSIFEPLQLGVKTFSPPRLPLPNGCEPTIHKTRQWFRSPPPLGTFPRSFSPSTSATL